MATFRYPKPDPTAKRHAALTSKLLLSPKKLDTLVSDIAMQYSPSPKKLPTRDYQWKTEAFDAGLPEDHPMRGFASTLKTEVKNILADPKVRGTNPYMVADAVAHKILLNRREGGYSLLDATHAYKRREDSQFFGEEVRAMPGYEDWLTGIQQAELQMERQRGREAWLPTPGEFAAGVGIGAAVGGMIAGPPGAMVGAGAAAIAEFLAKPASTALGTTEYVRSRTGPYSIGASWDEKLAALGLQVTPYLAAGFGVEDAALKAFTQMKPTAKVIAKISQFSGSAEQKGLVKRAADRLMSDEFMLDFSEVGFWKQAKQDPTREMASVMEDAITKATVERKGIAAGAVLRRPDPADPSRFRQQIIPKVTVGQMFRKLDPEGVERAITHPDGPKTGIEVAYEEMTPRKLSSGEGLVETQKQAVTGTYRANKRQAAWNRMVEEYTEKRQTELTPDPAAEAIQLRLDQLYPRRDAMGKPIEVPDNPMQARYSDIPKPADYVVKEEKPFDDLARAQNVRARIPHPSANKQVTVGNHAFNIVKQHPSVDFNTKHAVSSTGTKANKTAAQFEQDKASLISDETSRNILDTTTKRTQRQKELQLDNPIVNEDTIEFEGEVYDVLWTQKEGKTKAGKKFSPIRHVLVLDAEGKQIALPARTKKSLPKAIGKFREAENTEDAIKYFRQMVDEYKEEIADPTYQYIEDAGAMMNQVYEDFMKRTPYFDNEPLSVEDVLGMYKETLTKVRLSVLAEEITEQGERALTEIAGRKLDEIYEAAERMGLIQKMQPSQMLEGGTKRVDVAETWEQEGKRISREIEEAGAYGRQQFEADITKEMEAFRKDPAYHKRKSAKRIYNEAVDQVERFQEDSRSLRKTVDSLAILGMGAVGFVASMIGPEKAEAGVLSELGQMGAEQMKLIRSMAREGIVQQVEITKDVYKLTAEQFQKGLRPVEGGAKYILKHRKEWSAKAKDMNGRLWKYSGPYQIFEAAAGVGKDLPVNPANYRASYHAAEHNNIESMNQVWDNIFRESGIEGAYKEVRDAFAPVVEHQRRMLAYKHHTGKIGELEKEFKKVQKRKFKDEDPLDKEFDLRLIRQEIDEHKQALKDGNLGRETIETFQSEWAKVAEDVVQRVPSAKVALHVADGIEFKKMPWLRKYKLNYDEEVLVGRVRDQLAQYKARLEDIGQETIEGAYLPYQRNPNLTNEDLQRIADNNAGPAFLRVFERDFDSRPMLPDLHSTMRMYTPDIERRINQISFWERDGWTQVQKAFDDVPILRDAFKSMKEGVAPTDFRRSDQIANYYARFEVFKRLFLNPSAGLKHLIKASGDIIQVGWKETGKSAPVVAGAVVRRVLKQNRQVRESLAKMGMTDKAEQNRLLDSYVKSIVFARNTRHKLMDMGVTPKESIFRSARNIWEKSETIGGAWINLAELIDRSLSVVSALNIAAAKEGATIEQALYGVYDLVLKNNFLGREFNPAWLRNPKVRAALLFQATPFKILERRAVNALRSGRALKGLGKQIYERTKTGEGRSQLLQDLRQMRAYVKEGEQTAKTNIFIDALRSETDYFGNPIVYQTVTDMFWVGAATYGGSQAGLSLMHHFFHIPILNVTHKEPTLALSPGLQSVWRGWSAYKAREATDTEFLTTKIIKKWLGPYGPIPDTVRKFHRLTAGDIPEIYQGSHLQYLFAIPGEH